MLYNIKQAGGLKTSPMHVWLGLAIKAQTKQLNNLPITYW